MSPWKNCLLGDVANFKNGRTSPDRTDSGGMPVYGSNGVIGYSEQTNADPGTSIIGRVGSYCGSVYYSNIACWVTDNAIAGEPKAGKADRRFLYYLLKRLDLNRAAQGSGQPLLNQSILNSIELTVPSDVQEQKSIAEILSSLDEKIELNRKQNHTLEAIAKALYKRWFIEFEFPDENGNPYKSSGGAMQSSELGEIPAGWKVKPLDEIANYLNGLALQKFPPEGDEYLPVIKIRELKQGITANSDRASTKIDPKYIVEDGDVLFSWSGSLEVDIWCNGRGALNQHLFKVTSKDYPKWFYYFWTKHHLRAFQAVAADKATTMGHIQRSHLKEALTVSPPVEQLSVMTETFEPLIEKTITNRIENRSLATLRDTLLPKLMSGELRVA